MPIRIELKHFTRQFDATGLLHHFLDTHGLSAIPINFVFSLLRQGRLTLLLDGYDEMAQYMHPRERRVCLEALAELASGGGRGIITSRPNYFTEAEELRLLDSLYKRLATPSDLQSADPLYLQKEEALDNLFQQHFLDRYERRLRDLDEDQAKSWIEKALHDNPEGQAAVISILERVFRTTVDGEGVALAGKPVIVSYLLEVVDELSVKENAEPTGDNDGDLITETDLALTEWQAFSLIVGKLMLRDFGRNRELVPKQRRAFLRELAVKLSTSQSQSMTEPVFRGFIGKIFGAELRLLPTELREQEADRLFVDLRSSATLTRDPGQAGGGWRFSHNSLREFLAAEYMITTLESGKVDSITRFPVTDAMKTFVASLPQNRLEELVRRVAAARLEGVHGDVIGRFIGLLWDAAPRLIREETNSVEGLIEQLCGNPADFHDISLNRITVGGPEGTRTLKKANLTGCSLTDVDFTDVDLAGASFVGAALEGVSFKGANLAHCEFQGSILAEVDLTEANLDGARFQGIDPEWLLLRVDVDLFEGKEALGYLKWSGGLTPKVEDIYVVRHHPRFEIAEKIARKLTQQAVRQTLGLTKKGVAQRDPRAAQEFLDLLINKGLVDEMAGRNQVRITDEGKVALRSFCEQKSLDSRLAGYFS